ncbi:MAG: hypothetical protein VX741_01245 [Pseudomonadota bacterium]|nr:hypothetical protein [Pseudomonadota bacterium]
MAAPLKVVAFPGTGSIVHHIGADKGFDTDAVKYLDLSYYEKAEEIGN